MSNSNKKFDFLFKLLLIGNSNVGKTSLLYRFVDNLWDEKKKLPTTGIDFVRKF